MTIGVGDHISNPYYIDPWFVIHKINCKRRSYRFLCAEETKSTREGCKPGALDPTQQHTKMPADCYQNAPVD